MSRTQQYQASFTVGELDPLLRGRIDLQQYYSSVDLADNVVSVSYTHLTLPTIYSV